MSGINKSQFIVLQVNNRIKKVMNLSKVVLA